MVKKGWFSRPTKKSKISKVRRKSAWRPDEVKYAMDGFSPRKIKRVKYRLLADKGDHASWSAVKTRAFNIAHGIPQVSLERAIAMDQMS